MARSLFLFLSFVALALGQGAPAPAITSAASPGAGTCNGCYVIADVAVIVFGEEQLVETATNIVSVGVGKNGTQVTTSFLSPAGEFSFGPSGLLTGGGEVAFPTGTIVTVNGATLTSPTAYNVFTAYSVTSVVSSNGQCVTVSGPATTLSPAFSLAIPANAGPDYIFQAEQSFINDIGGVSCAPGGVGQMSTTTQIPVSATTVQNTVTGPLRPTPAPISSSTVAQSTSTKVVSALPDTLSSANSSKLTTISGSVTLLKPSTIVSTISLPSNATGTIVIVGNSTGLVTGSGPSQTIIPFTGTASVLFSPSYLSTMIGAAALLLPGILAWIL